MVVEGWGLGKEGKGELGCGAFVVFGVQAGKVMDSFDLGCDGVRLCTNIGGGEIVNRFTHVHLLASAFVHLTFCWLRPRVPTGREWHGISSGRSQEN